ncbi:MAG: hypothetical protein IJ491_06115 [Clostridia bacterium]|nr:hypothetical protein [Clostridia bacterium]
MKTKRLTAILLAVAIALIAFSAFMPTSEYYSKYKKYKYAYFPDYSSINHSLSEKDKEKAEQVLSVAREVFTCVGEAPSLDVGELERYYRLSPDIERISLDLEAVAGDFTMGNGYLWVVYSVTRYDFSGEVHSGSWDILSLWKLKNKDGVWTVTSIKEPA